MATQVQNRRGTTAEHSTFTGAVGELTVDTTKDVVVVHDGSTAGGFPMLRQDQANLPTSAPSNGVYIPSSNNVAISTNGTGRLFVDSSGRLTSQGFSSYRGNTYTIASFSANTTLGPLNIVQGNTGTHPSISAGQNSSGTYASLGLLTSDKYRLLIDPTGTSTFTSDASTAPLVVNIGASEVARIDSSGRLGLGTSTPGTLLDVVNGIGRIRTGGKVGSNTYLKLESTDASNSMELQFGNSTNASWSIQSVENGISNRSLLLNPNGGRVGIGNNLPSFTIDIKAATDSQLRVNNSNETSHGSHDARIVAGGTYYQNPVIAGSSIKFNTFNGSSEGERARIDSSGRLLVGTSSVYNVPTGDGGIRSPGLQRAATTFADSSISSTLFNTATEGGGTITLSRSNTTTLGAQAIAASQDATGSIWFSASDGVTQIPTASIVSRVDGTPGTNDMPGRLVFSTTADGASSPTERMRIDSTGNAVISTLNAYIRLKSASTDFDISAQNGGTDFLRISANGTQRYQFTASGAAYNSTGTWGTISDLRLKDNVVDATGKLHDLQKLRVVNYNLKSDPEVKHIGFVAQEVETVFPSVVEVAGSDDQNKDIKAVKTTVLVPILVKALQEAVARIETLEAKVAALEGV